MDWANAIGWISALGFFVLLSAYVLYRVERERDERR